MPALRIRRLPSCDTPGKSLSQHEDLHVNDLRDAFNGDLLDSKYTTEGFGSLEACEAARNGFADWFKDYVAGGHAASKAQRDSCQ